MNKNDSALSIIKSIKPVDFSYSKKGKEFSKFFSASSLQHLFKKANKKIKVAKKFELPVLKEAKKVNTDIVNIKINSSFNYVTELSSLKNFKVSSMKKKKITQEDIDKMNLYKELFYVTKEKIVDMDFRKKRFKRIKDKYLEFKSYGVKEVTLDPGKYHPKYDILYKRNPVTFFGTKDLENKDDQLKININDNNKNNMLILNKNNSADNLFIRKNKNKPEQIRKNKKTDKSTDDNNKNETNTKNMNVIPLSQTNYNPKRYTSSDGFLQIEKINSFKISKKLSTASNDRKITTKRKIFKKSSSVSNIDKIKCPILFNRMPGRERKVVVTPNYIEVDYSPKYDITRPHVPATIFRHTFDYSKFKKYITSKIIRSYCFTPDKYFILEINQNMENNNIPGRYNKNNNILNYN